MLFVCFHIKHVILLYTYILYLLKHTVDVWHFEEHKILFFTLKNCLVWHLDLHIHLTKPCPVPVDFWVAMVRKTIMYFPLKLRKSLLITLKCYFINFIDCLIGLGYYIEYLVIIYILYFACLFLAFCRIPRYFIECRIQHFAGNIYTSWVPTYIYFTSSKNYNIHIICSFNIVFVDLHWVLNSMKFLSDQTGLLSCWLFELLQKANCEIWWFSWTSAFIINSVNCIVSFI